MSTVIRIWKRDGYENRMSLEAAVKNLADKGSNYTPAIPVQTRRSDARQRLLSGQYVETPLALFRLAL